LPEAATARSGWVCLAVLGSYFLFFFCLLSSSKFSFSHIHNPFLRCFHSVFFFPLSSYISSILFCRLTFSPLYFQLGFSPFSRRCVLVCLALLSFLIFLFYSSILQLFPHRRGLVAAATLGNVKGSSGGCRCPPIPVLFFSVVLVKTSPCLSLRLALGSFLLVLIHFFVRPVISVFSFRSLLPCSSIFPCFRLFCSLPFSPPHFHPPTVLILTSFPSFPQPR